MVKKTKVEFEYYKLEKPKKGEILALTFLDTPQKEEVFKLNRQLDSQKNKKIFLLPKNVYLIKRKKNRKNLDKKELRKKKIKCICCGEEIYRVIDGGLMQYVNDLSKSKIGFINTHTCNLSEKGEW